MTATVIISIAAVGLLMGVVHARGELHALEVKERASEELLNYMEYFYLICFVVLSEICNIDWFVLQELENIVEGVRL